LFRERGLPLAIRSDNGVPFASPNALFNLSKLSVRWLRLGIAIDRIKPGHPQQPPRTHAPYPQKGSNPTAGLKQPAYAKRPHEALDMECPAELYITSIRRYDGLPN
jgi:hypothetical protein